MGYAAVAQPAQTLQPQSPATTAVAPQTSAQTPVQTSAATSAPTSAQSRIAAAKKHIQAHPKDTQPYAELALASLRRARETDDPNCYHDAEHAIAAGLALQPNDFQLAKARVAVLLARHEFSKAREEAAALNRRTPDDVTTYQYLAEADIALGNYPDAEKAAQWMLDLLPNNVPGLLTAAELRELYGDPEGALELLNQAYRETAPTENEELAWIANQIALVEIHSGKQDAASQVLERAEQIFPGYPATLENLSLLSIEQHKYADAVARLRREQTIRSASTAQDAHRLFLLARAEELAHQDGEAAATYAQFEAVAKRLASAPANANRELIFYYADHSYADHVDKWPQALQVAQHEIGVRHDVWTLDAYAWALYRTGRYADADTQMQKALAVGIRSSQLFDHAGNVALKLHKQPEAEHYFESALLVDPGSEYAADARKTLASFAVAPPATTQLPPSPSAPAIAEKSEKAEKADAALPPPAANATATAAPRQPSIPFQTDALPHPLHAFPPVPATLLTPQPTGTARVVRTMQARVARNPTDAKAYASLGAAFFQLARETGDVENYQLAEQSLTRSLDLVSADITAAAPLATLAEVCMGEHRFQDALAYAQKALSLGSGDLSPYAIVGDAYADMGEYDQAAAAYARLTPLDEQTPQPHTAYVRDSRISYLKFISGDTASAIRLMQSAVAAGIEARLPKENLAWLNFELGEYYFQAGDAEAADASYLAALITHPGDYRALAALGKVRANQGKFADAIALYQKAIAVVPMPIYVAELGDLYAKAGNSPEAQKQYQLVEYIALLGHVNQVLHNRDLALFYADHDKNLSESVALAHKEFEVRHDVYTWDALAWALYKGGKYPDAEQAMDQALRFNTRDALLLYHAGMISAQLGQTVQAEQQLTTALKINPRFHVLYADAARKQLALLQTQLRQTASGAKSDAH